GLPFDRALRREGALEAPALSGRPDRRALQRPPDPRRAEVPRGGREAQDPPINPLLPGEGALDAHAVAAHHQEELVRAEGAVQHARGTDVSHHREALRVLAPARAGPAPALLPAADRERSH